MNAPASAGVPILRLGDVLVTGLLNELDDKTAVAFTEELTARITGDRARGSSSTFPGWKSSIPSWPVL